MLLNRLILIVALVLVLSILLGDAFLVSVYWSKIFDPSNFEKVGSFIQGVSTPVVSIVTIFFSFLVINQQFRQNQEIERIKRRLDERYKRESDANFRLWVAISRSYRLLSPLQTGTITPQMREGIDAVFAEAEPFAFVVTAQQHELFYTYWQAVAELVAKALAAATDDERRTAWEGVARKLGRLHDEIRMQFRDYFLETGREREAR